MHNGAINSYMRFILILLISALVCGCSNQQDKLLGKYKAVSIGSTDSVSASLELLADGKGFWSIETDNAPFRWDLHQNKIRLHTKSGGVIVGTLDNDTIQFSLPGMRLIHFQRNQ
jgi:hypothetical protein